MKTAIYVRQSLEKKDSLSLEGQEDLCKKQLLECETFEVYSDSGFSGKNINRPAMTKLVEDIEAGLISKVICYKLDRISRSILDFNNLFVLFQKYKVEFISCTESLDTSNPMGRAMINIIATFAQLERETISMRIKDNYYKRGTTGAFLGGTVPYGYKKGTEIINGKKTSILEPNEEQLEVIKRLFEEYSNSIRTLGDIVKNLNKEGIKTAQGRTWSTSTVGRLLRSSLYVKADVDIYNYYKSKGAIITNDIGDFEGVNGLFIYGDNNSSKRKNEDVKGQTASLSYHEGIIDSKTFLKVQHRLDNNKQINNNGGYGKLSWLTGIVKCGKCSYSMSAVKNYLGKRYMVCKGRANHNGCEGHSKAILAEELELLIQNKIINKIEELSKVKLSLETKQTTNINKLKMELSKIDEDINNLMSKVLTANDILMEYINIEIKKLDDQKKLIFNKIQEETIKQDSIDSVENIIKKGLNFENLDFELKKDICKTLINKILIVDEDITIEWKV
ncbi:recombinase family protein [Clostridium nigeriense]|uniref:recombinase family protein n=1 Tax=Clostridium nigeriense TaxID=1805470 RepID=UPI0008313B22|nr:recombinase family protein [Clostridium nigeriense]